MERPEPYGFALKDGNYFRADEDLPPWERYVGWHDWTVLLNGEMEQLHVTARACLDGRHPVNQAEDVEGDLSFGAQLLAGLPQFFLCVWELELNGWSRLIPEDPVSRILLKIRGARPVGRYRSAVDAAFVEAFTLARVLERRPALRDGLAALRQRHASYQVAHPWCWLRFFWERHEAFDILSLLQDELRRWQGSAIVTPDQLRCERWHQAAQQRLRDLMGADPGQNWPTEDVVPARCSPGFDWNVPLAGPVDVTDLAQGILRSLEGYDPASIVEELANEFAFFSAWVNRGEAGQEPNVVRTKRSPLLFLHRCLSGPSGNPYKRSESSGYSPKKWHWYRPEDQPDLWIRFVGWRDWAAHLGLELGSLQILAVGCQTGRHPITAVKDIHGLPFPEALLLAIPQFVLSVWELDLNHWCPMPPSDSVSRILLEARQRQPVRGYRSAVEAVFRLAFTVAAALEQSCDLKDGLSALRQRHARHHADNPWCWLRFHVDAGQFNDIAMLLQEDLRRTEGNSICTGERERFERWHQAAQERLSGWLRAGPGFDWSLAAVVDSTGLANHIVRLLEGFNESQLSEELANEFHYVSEWVDQCKREAEDAWVDQLTREAEGLDDEAIDQMLTETSLAVEEWPETPPAPTGPPVVLRGRGEGPIVLGKTKKKLTKGQYNVVKALLDAGDLGLTKDELVNKSGHEDARGILARLAEKDDWKEVIHFAGQTGGGYRIK